MNQEQREQLAMFIGWLGYSEDEAKTIVNQVATWLNTTGPRYIAGGPTS